MEKRENLHLLWRSGFGPKIEDFGDLDHLTREQLWKKVKSNISNAKPIVSTSGFVQDNYDKITDRRLAPKEKEEWNSRIRRQSAKDLKELNNSWIDWMIESNDQLTEKMSFFWHHHFAIRHPNSFLQQEAINIIRKLALGNFGDLLRAVSKSGAMILSLNNQQNKKSSPNENFAREIMELFAMGIGNYTENDIREAARAFTGWSISREGRFVFKNEEHDNGIKRVLGKTGNFHGDDIVDIILQQPQTATFIVTKLYRFLVNEIPDVGRIQKLAETFRKDYEILGLLENIFTSDWFYEPQNIGGKVKSPIELIVGVQRMSPFDTIEPDIRLSIQKLLGQVLFHPPSIAGWPMGKSWMDSSTLMVRLQLPQILNGNISVKLKNKSNDDVNMGREDESDQIDISTKKEFRANKKWAAWSTSGGRNTLPSDFLLTVLTKEKSILIQDQTNKSYSEGMYRMMSMPEYQLC